MNQIYSLSLSLTQLDTKDLKHQFHLSFFKMCMYLVKGAKVIILKYMGQILSTAFF